MKTKNLLLLILFAFAFTSFRTNLSMDEVAGVYGICSSEKEQGPNFEVTLKNDGNFHYVNSFNSKSPIDVTGKWVLSGNTIKLVDFVSSVKIHDKWQFDNTGICIKSRKGLEYSRLCQIK